MDATKTCIPEEISATSLTCSSRTHGADISYIVEPRAGGFAASSVAMERRLETPAGLREICAPLPRTLASSHSSPCLQIQPCMQPDPSSASRPTTIRDGTLDCSIGLLPLASMIPPLRSRATHRLMDAVDPDSRDDVQHVRKRETYRISGGWRLVAGGSRFVELHAIYSMTRGRRTTFGPTG